MTNYEWLLQMDGAARKSWFDAEHAEGDNTALEATTAAVECQPMRDLLAELDELESQCNALARDLGECMADRDMYRRMCGEMLDAADDIRFIAESYDRGLA